MSTLSTRNQHPSQNLKCIKYIKYAWVFLPSLIHNLKCLLCICIPKFLLRNPSKSTELNKHFQTPISSCLVVCVLDNHQDYTDRKQS